MNSLQNPLLEELTAFFREFFMDDAIALGPSTTSQDLAGWDSLTNISLMLAVQRRFSVWFSARDQEGLRTVGDLAALLRTHLKLPEAAS